MKRKLKKLLFKTIRVVGRAIYGRRIWLVSDRAAIAGDNGEAFFKYLNEHGVDSVFAIKQKSDDYNRIKTYGRTVEYESFKHKLLLCVCECHASSQTLHMDNHEECPQIFLQHGVIHSDCSKFLNPISHKNFYILTSGYDEKNNLSSEKYNIRNENIWLTGLPRFDLLKNKPQKKIAIVFTWRSKLQYVPAKEVVDSPYVKTIIRIVRDEVINSIIESAGYELSIKMHPEMNFILKLMPEDVRQKVYMDSYNKLYEEASLLITDYSSAIYDFAYLGKPIIYYQFDKGDYFDNPFTSKGDYDYEKEGFGPVTYSFDEFVKELEKIINNNCAMEEKYKDRADKFFAYHDRNNCERVYQNIKRLIG